MKKVLLFVGLLTGFGTTAQDCSELFISEYVEGWSNNKALEIYNPTNASIDLSQYFVARFSNGSTTAGAAQSVQLTGTIAPYGTYVAVLDKRDDLGTGQNAPVWDSLQAKADGFYTEDYGVSSAFYFNGNDAVVLGKGSFDNVAGAQVVDIFGKIGEDPGVAWTSDFPYTGAGVELTKDHSLIRKSTILKGETNFQISFFNALVEYDSIPPVVVRLDANGDTLFAQSGNPIVDGNWSSLGEHACGCAPLSTEEIEKVSFSIFPNPSIDGVVYVKSNIELSSIEVVNGLGQTVASQIASGKFNTVQLPVNKGLYFLHITSSNGAVTTKRVVIK